MSKIPLNSDWSNLVDNNLGGCFKTRSRHFHAWCLRPVASIGEILVMDALISYKSSSSNSDGERVTEGESPGKKVVIGNMPAVLTVEDDSDENEALNLVDLDEMDKASSEPEVSNSDRGRSTFGSEGFHPTESDQQDESDLIPGEGLVAETNISSPRSAVGGKSNPYALHMGDHNPEMRAFLSSVKKYFTQTVNLERQKAALCAETYDKAQERILGTYISWNSLLFSSRSVSRAHLISVN